MTEHIKDILASDLLERYVIGSVSDAEKLKVELLAVDHSVIRKELRKLEMAVEKMSQDNALKAPGEVRECIIKSISGQNIKSAATPQQPTQFLNSLPLKIAASILFGGLAMWLLMQQSLNSSKATIDRQSQEIAALQDQCDALGEQYAFINHSSTIPVLLEGTDRAPESQVVIFWNEELQQSMMRVIELPSIRDDQTYQLWADVEGEMLSLGVFDPALATVDPISMNYLANAESLNITVEPLGGSDHPTVSTLTASKVI